MNGKELDLTPIKRSRSLVEEVVESISTYVLHGLLEGRLQPGDKLPSERELAEKLQIGRSTLREATQVLVVLRLLEIKPGQGTFIIDRTSEFNAEPFSWGLILQKKSLNELIEIRVLIESECAALAATRATDAELNEIKQSFQRMEKAENEQHEKALVEADVHFHLQTALAAHNNIMYQTLRTIRTIMQLWISKVFKDDGKSLKLTVEEHRRILNALLQRNAQKAREAMKKHILTASHRLKQIKLN